MKTFSKRISICFLASAMAVFTFFAAFSAPKSEAYGEESPLFFSSDEEIEVNYDKKDTRGVSGAELKVKNVNGKDKITVNYDNYIKKSELSGGFLNVSFTPEEFDVKPFIYVLVTLTDAADESEKLTIATGPQSDTSGYWGKDWCMSWVALTDELVPARKVKFANADILKIAGTEQEVMGRNNVFYSGHSLYEGPYMASGYNIGRQYDYFVKDSSLADENGNVVMNSLNFAFSGSSAKINGTLIADVSDEDFRKRSKEKLEGTEYAKLYDEENVSSLFSSGYAKLSLTFMNCGADDIVMHIKKIGSQDLSSGEKITYASPYFAANHDTHAVKGEPFVIPMVKISDLREGDISARAEFSVKDGDGNSVAISDGKACFTSAGVYSLVFSVSLSGGQTFSETKTLNVYENMPRTDFAGGVSFDAEYIMGDEIVIPEMKATNRLSTKEGFAVVPEVLVQADGIVIANFKADETHYFTLEKAGEYIISYCFANAYGIINSYNRSFKVNSSLGINPYYIPVTYTSGKKNTFADAEIKNYINDVGEQELYRAIYLGDKQVYLAKGKDVLSGSLAVSDKIDRKTVPLTYKAGFSESELLYSKTFVLPVINAVYAEDYIAIKDQDGNYVTEGVETAESKEQIIFIADGELEFVFPQRLPAEGTEISFDVLEGYGANPSVSVILSDYYRPSKKIVYKAEKSDASYSALYVNGAYAGTISGSLENDKSYFTWKTSGNGSIKDAYGAALCDAAKTWNDGSAFDGFTDGTVVVSLKTDGASEDNKIALAIKKIGNQPFFTSYNSKGKTKFDDYVAPVIKLDGETDFRSVRLGSKIQVPKATAYDVLSPDSSVRVSLESPIGEVFTGRNGEDDISFIADEIGKWILTFTATEAGGMFATEERIVINVKDKTPPKIYVNGEVKSKVSVGETVVFPTSQVFDNISENCPCFILVIGADGFRQVAKDGKFTFTEKGEYRIVYYAHDEFYNNVSVEYTLTAE